MNKYISKVHSDVCKAFNSATKLNNNLAEFPADGGMGDYTNDILNKLNDARQKYYKKKFYSRRIIMKVVTG